jgi:hypothetical protein
MDQFQSFARGDSLDYFPYNIALYFSHLAKKKSGPSPLV